MTPHILFKLASRSRPEKFFKALDNIHSLVADKENFSIICSLDEDDKSMTKHFMNMQDYAEFNKKYPNTKAIFGKSKNKIDAINRDLKQVHFDILVNMSDDMEFIVEGFDNVIRLAFITDPYAGLSYTSTDYNFDKFIHFNDGNQKANVCTMSIMGWDYYRRNGYIYNPNYKSVWCDVEATDEACILGKYKYMGDDLVIFNHKHPAFGLAEYDEQYRASESLDVWGEDLQTIIERKRNNYGLGNFLFNEKYPANEIGKWIKDLNNARQNQGLKPIEFK